MDDHTHPPLNQAGIIVSPRAHYLEDPPRIVGLEGVLNAGATSQQDTKGGVPLAIGHGNDSVLIRRRRRHDAPIEPAGLSAVGTGFDVSLTRGVVFLDYNMD